MSKVNSMIRIAFVLAATLCFSALASEIGESNRRLNFLVDNDLIIQSVSKEGMEFFAKASEIIGHDIFSKLPLDHFKRSQIQKVFNQALASRETRQVQYSLDPHAMNPNMGVAEPTQLFFKAEITPLFNADDAHTGFFIKVTQLPSTRDFLE